MSGRPASDQVTSGKPAPGRSTAQEPASAQAPSALAGGLLDPTGRPALVRFVIALLNDRRIRYLIVGGIAAVVYYSIFAVGWLLAAGRIHYLVMVLIANFGNAIATFPLYRRYVFQSTGPILPGFLRFYVLCLGSLVYTLVIMPVLVEVTHVPVLISNAILVVTWPLLNYQLNKYWAFRHR